MSQIYKYPIYPRQPMDFTVDMPVDAKILTIQMQGPVMTIWALVDPGFVPAPRKMRIEWTGTGFVASDLEYIATCQDLSTGLVWHLFDYGVYE